MHGLRIVGLVSGHPSPFDGKWLREYDPDRRGVDPSGRPMLAHILCTDDPAKALAFEDAAAAFAVWRKPSQKWPHAGRLDGGVSRPLTAFTCEVVPLPS